MVKKIRVSRQGLTRCPSCKNHIKVADPINKTICSFCETSLAESLGTETGEVILGTRKVSGGSRALLAATILGLPMSGCAGSEPAPNDIVVDAGLPDIVNQPAYGVAMDIVLPPEDESTNIDVEPAPDENFMPEYGLPMDVIDPPVDEGNPDMGQQQPAYGIPMDMMEPPVDEGMAIDAEPAPDENFMPEYGIPPEEN